jgi:hypothetical protein
MYVTVRRYKSDPAKHPEIIKVVEDEFVPILRRSMGFISYTVFSDDDGSICSVSTFDTRAGMEEANMMARDWAKSNLQTLLPHPPDVIQGDSLLHRRR